MNMKKLFLIIIVSTMILNCSLYSNEFDMNYFYNIYGKYRSAPENLMLMKHEHVIKELEVIKALNKTVQIEQVGNSVENRSINLVSFGKGKTKILLWSQMHGNEPTATAALLAIYKYFAENIENPFVKKLYENLSIHSLVMLNPDGAERFQRRNAYDIDINRDAKKLQTPEGQILKKMQERIKPDFGFNLHNMGGRETVEGTDNILKIALMAPPFNKKNEDNPTRINAKKVTVHIKSILDKYINGHVARYKAGFMPRAFGDAMQFWGVSTILVETGSYTPDDPIFLEKLNFVSLLSVFDIVANDKLEKVDHTKYDKIPLEGKTVFDLLIKNAMIINGTKAKPFKGDVGINIDYRLVNGKIDTLGYIKDIGDLSIYKGKKIIDAENYVLTPGFIGVLSNEKKSELLKKGFTTIVKNKENFEIANEKIVSINKIPELTSKLARKFKLGKKGQIKRNYSADLLLFSAKDKNSIDLGDLKTIIQNGRIVNLK